MHDWAGSCGHAASATLARNNLNSPYGRYGRSNQNRSGENPRRCARGAEVVGRFAGSTFACVDVRCLRARKAFHSACSDGSGDTVSEMWWKVVPTPVILFRRSVPRPPRNPYLHRWFVYQKPGRERRCRRDCRLPRTSALRARARR
jgi:hypothetical protein